MRRSLMVLLACVAVLVGSGPLAGSDGTLHLSHEERAAALRALDVRPGPAGVELAGSGSAIEVRPGRGYLAGDAARRFMSLTQGVAYPATEAVVIGGGRGFVFVEHFDVGYVPASDWAGFDPARLMAGIRAATRRANARRGSGVGGGIEVVGWAEEPRLVGPAGDGVRWAIRAVEGDGRVTVNAVVLRLGRRGYQKLTWVGAEAAYETAAAAGSPPHPPTAAGGLLEEVAAGHRFRPGHAHGDRAAGDPVAPFGLAALVAATAGGEPAPGRNGRVVAAAAGIVPDGWPVAALLLAGWVLGWIVARARPSLRAGRILSAAGWGQNKGHERRRP